MAAVVVAGRHPVYELTAADLVVRQLSDLSFVNLKQLFRNEELSTLGVCAAPFSHAVLKPDARLVHPEFCVRYLTKITQSYTEASKRGIGEHRFTLLHC